MLFHYYFLGDKLDLTKFRKQAIHYMERLRQIQYGLFLPRYKVSVEIDGVDNSTEHMATITLADIVRDEDKNIINILTVYPLLDTRFKESKDIKSIFDINSYRGTFTSASVVHTVDKICSLIKYLYKIENLKVFL